MDPGTHTVYVCNFDDGTVSVIDGSTRTVTATVGGSGSGGYTGTGPDPSKPSPLGLAGAIICFTILILAVLFGIVVIIFGK